MSRDAVGAQETWATPSPQGVVGASRPPFSSRIEVYEVVSLREGQVDVKSPYFHCSTGIMVPGGEDWAP